MNKRVVVVTGGGNGIGKAIAKAYAADAATVVILEKNEQTGKTVEDDINKNYGQAMFIKTDVRSASDIRYAVKTIMNMFGRIDVLINNAGVSRFKSLFDLSIEEWDDVININLRGQFLCAREVAHYMKNQSRGGAIVNIASTRAFMSERHSEAYAASKGGIIALTHALAASLSSSFITVNAISPGWIETGDYNKLTPSDHEQHLSRRVGKPEDIARVCLFLTDPKNNFMTGENIIVDGGMTKKMIYKD